MGFPQPVPSTPNDITIGGTVFADSLALGGTEQDSTINGTLITFRDVIHEDGGITNVELGVHRHNDTAAVGPAIEFARSRGTEANETAVQNGDRLLNIVADGFDGTDYSLAAAIRAEVDGAPGANDTPGRLVFLTSPDGSQTLAEGLRLSQDKTLSIAGPLDHNGTTLAFYGGAQRAQAGAISDPSGGVVVDSQSRTAIVAILTMLRASTGVSLIAG